MFFKFPKSEKYFMIANRIFVSYQKLNFRTMHSVSIIEIKKYVLERLMVMRHKRSHKLNFISHKLLAI